MVTDRIASISVRCFSYERLEAMIEYFFEADVMMLDMLS